MFYLIYSINIMDFNFRNKSIKLKKLDSSRISHIIQDISKQQQNKVKQFLNEKQINDYLNNIAQTIKDDANEYIYKTTIETLI